MSNLHERFEESLKTVPTLAVKLPCPDGLGPWTPKECGAALGVSAQTIRDAISFGELQAFEIRGRGLRTGISATSQKKESAPQRRTFRITRDAWEKYVSRCMSGRN